MGLLRVARLGAELPWAFAQILLAVQLLNAAPGCADRLIRQVHGVGPHVGDEPSLVQPLGAAHGFPSREPQLAVGLLLQGACGERGDWLTNRRFLLHRIDGPGSGLHLLRQCPRLLFAEQAHITPGFETTGALVKIAPVGNALAGDVGELGLKPMARLIELGLEIPVTAASEGSSGPLAQHQQANGNGLHTTG